MSSSIDWKGRWEAERIGFHNNAVHRDLVAYQAQFLGADPQRVLVPLCGKTLDMRWLDDQGHTVVGVELVEKGVIDYFAEQALTPTRSHVGAFDQFAAGNTTILRGDIFGLDDQTLEPVTRIWDRAALVALPPSVRGRYVATLRANAATGAMVLLSSFTYDQTAMTGPPFSVSQDEVREHYTGCTIDVLSERDDAEVIPFPGHDWWLTTTYLIQLP